jgi:hypothetical protein
MNRSTLLLSLVLLICIVVVVGSVLAQEQLATLLGPFRFRDFSRFFRFVTPGNPSTPNVDVVRHPSLLVATGRGLLSALASYAFLFFAGVLTLFGFPGQLRAVRDSYTQGVNTLLRMLAIGGFGTLVVVLLVMLGVLTFAAFPLPLVLLVALLLAAWGGLVGLTLAVGQFINRWAGIKNSSPLLDLAFGTLVLFSLTKIPFAGTILLVLLTMWALGAVLLTRFGQGGAWSLTAFSQLEESHS